MTSNSLPFSLDARELSAAEGLLILVTRALDKLGPGDVLEILSANASTQHDLPAWSRLTPHRFLGTTSLDGRWVHRIEKGSVRRILTGRDLDWGNRAPIRDGRFDPRHWLLG